MKCNKFVSYYSSALNLYLGQRDSSFTVILLFVIVLIILIAGLF